MIASLEDQSPKSQSRTAFPNCVPETETKVLETKADMLTGPILSFGIYCHLKLQIQFHSLRHHLPTIWDEQTPHPSHPNQ